MTNYVASVRTELAARLPDCDSDLLDLYTLLGLTFGTATDPRVVHDAWAVWRNRSNPEHRSLIPFDQLSHEVQELDRPYVEAIRAAVVAAGRPGVLEEPLHHSPASVVPQYAGPMTPVYPCRELETRHCPAIYNDVCGERPCARFESEDETPWRPELLVGDGRYQDTHNASSVAFGDDRGIARVPVDEAAGCTEVRKSEDREKCFDLRCPRCHAHNANSVVVDMPETVEVTYVLVDPCAGGRCTDPEAHAEGGHDV